MENSAESYKKKVSLKNMEYTRFIGIRYALALLFFANLNWFVSLIVSKSPLLFIPLLLLMYITLPIYEQIRLYGNKETSLKHIKKYFTIQLIVNILLLALSLFSSFYRMAFPFMATSLQGFIGIVFVLILGTLIVATSLRKLVKIHNKKDRLYKEVLKYKKALKVSE
ncbi:hypothetical protein SAMN04488700_0139 [Carnobacterium iners]|uniref:Uncharacterized protein n=1 Tax=Carnobacterium iners TaxID=1073423 RepID=A0A1X7MQ47_9LACT|nr:hypothetical protein [Carnobacterium iners]SEK78082.1 hypothetical protein SAMN04488114_11143 [Carnobacterium iners]SMH26468.1 hypothetical protein SAMN04488700_0139 [Carnobacterium iners]